TRSAAATLVVAAALRVKLLYPHNQLPKILILSHRPMDLSNLLERIHMLDNRLYLPVCQQGYDTRGKTARDRQLLLQRTRTKGHAAYGNTLAHQHTEIHIRLRTSHCRQEDHPSPHSQGLQVLFHIGCTNKIDDHVYAPSACQAVHGLRKILIR